MAKIETLADFLGTDSTLVAPEPSVPYENLTGKEFAEAVLNSIEFRRYIVNMLTLGDMPAAVLCRLMDYGWGKPVERVEHTGKDGQPIEVTEVRRTIVRASLEDFSERDETAVTKH